MADNTKKIMNLDTLTRYNELIQKLIAASNTNTTYTLTRTDDTITLTGSDGSETEIEIADNGVSTIDVLDSDPDSPETGQIWITSA